MQPFSFFFLLAIRWAISGRVRALNLTVPLGSGRVGSDNLGYGPGSGFSFEPVQTSVVSITSKQRKEDPDLLVFRIFALCCLSCPGR